ncbi:MAG: hypothetical protein R3Y63_03200 [Eubacteriales bacterium]
MKRILHWAIVLLLILEIPISYAAPYQTYVLNKEGRPSFSPALYEPLTTIDHGFSGLTDMFLDKEGDLYIAEQQRISVLDESGELKVLVDEDHLRNATSLFVDQDFIYVADKSDKKLKLFSLSGKLVLEIEKPSSPLYGEKENFVPIKVVVNANQDIFVISDGNTNGVVQFNKTGDFIGYFGRNTATTDFFQQMREKVLDGTALGNLIMVVPPSVQTMDIDEKDVIYASTVGTVEERVRKLNMAGNNIFIENPVEADLVQKIDDIVVQEHFVMMLNNFDGSIMIADKSGTPFGIFGSKTNDIPVTGLFLTPLALEIDENNNIYVLDNTLNNIQVFAPTTLMKHIYNATDLYHKGKYAESKEIWEEILVINPSFALARDSIGDIEMKNYNYAEALAHYEQANNRNGYSDALWEIRQVGITEYLGIAMLLCIIAFFGSEIYRKFFSKHPAILRAKGKYEKIYEIKFFHDLRLMKKVFQKPDYAFYDIRSKDVISIKSAVVILFVFVFLVIFSSIHTNYIFRTENIARISFLSKFGQVFGVVLLFVISNYLIISILDGEGKIGHIFIGTVYAMAPMILFLFPVALFSNFLTLNDVFFYNILNYIMYGLTIIFLLIMIIEVHNYNFMEGVKVFALTLFTMVLLVIIAVCLYALFTQILLFVERTVREVVVRV